MVNQDTFGTLDSDFYRIGVFGEWYAGDMFTLGGAVHYSDGTIIQDAGDDDVDRSAWEFTANARFYVTPDFSLMVQGDYYTADIDGDFGHTNVDEDGWAITGEGEYLVWDQGLSVFAGARYAERTLEFSDEGESVEFNIDDTQVYAGIKFYFGNDGTLIERQRTGLSDNTSTMFEKLPATLNALTAVDED